MKLSWYIFVELKKFAAKTENEIVRENFRRIGMKLRSRKKVELSQKRLPKNTVSAYLVRILGFRTNSKLPRYHTR